MGTSSLLRISGILLLAGPVLGGTVLAGDLSGEVSIEGRAFPQAPVQIGRYRSNLSVMIEPELYIEWNAGRQSVSFTPFLRIDQHDSRRSHIDIRELLWRYSAANWDVRTGIGKVFWGVAESNHLVDVINQTDLVEDLDGEEKLGQPMVNLTWVRDWGTLDFFLLPGFRQRRFWGIEGRPGVPFPFDNRPLFEANNGRGHVDLAVRWFHVAGPWDIGVSHFRGTSRDPRFILYSTGKGPTTFRPFYDLIHQTGLDVQLTQGGWLWKLEWINRFGQGDRFMAAVGGFEYTFSNIRSSGIDLGVLAEFNFDERESKALTPLEDDFFTGIRLALNDAQSTEGLAGVVIDRESGACFLSIEASRRFGSHWTLDLEVRSLFNVPADDFFLYGIRKDDYVQASWSLHF